MLDTVLHRDANSDTPKYVAPDLSYLLDRIVNVCFIGAPGARETGSDDQGCAVHLRPPPR